MSGKRTRTRLAASVLAAALWAGVAVGDEAPADGGMRPQKVVKHAFVDAVLGTWQVTTGGAMGEGKGTSTWTLGLGGTCVFEDYRNTGGMGEFFGHGTYKVADDGKTVAAWWIDSFSAEPSKMTGPLTDTGFDVRAGAARITLTKVPTGLEFKMYRGDQLQMTGAYVKK